MILQDFINTDINVIGVFDLVFYDQNFGLLYKELNLLKKDHYTPSDKIIILHNDTEYYYQGNKLGFTMHNLFTCWRDLDIPYHVMVIYANHSDLEAAVEPFIVNQHDRPLIIPTMVNNQSVKVISNIPLLEISKNIQNNAFCLMGVSRQHRIKFFQYLSKNNLFNHIKVNYISKFYQDSKKFEFDKKQKNVVYHTDKLSNLISTHPHRINENCFLQSCYKDIVDLNSFDVAPRQDLEGELKNFYKDFFLEVVLETVFDYPHVFISEKILKPLLFKTPFVLFGAMGTLDYLKKNGFKTFNDFWDESYDFESDPHARFLKCCALVHSIIMKPTNELKDIHKKMLPVLEHNHTQLVKYVDNIYKPLYNKINL
jgi:hypothetical protein